MTDKEIIIDGVDVSKCNYAILPKKQCPMQSMPYAKETSCIACKEHNTKRNFCKNNPNCYFKQLKRQQYYLEKIRAYELNSLDVDWDEYEQHACDTEYSPIIDYVELALGEKEDE